MTTLGGIEVPPVTLCISYKTKQKYSFNTTFNKNTAQNQAPIYFETWTLWSLTCTKGKQGLTSGARFLKVPKLSRRISGDKIRCLEAQNFAVILIFIPFTTYEKTSFTEKAGHSFMNGFLGPKSFWDFWEMGPRSLKLNPVGQGC